MSRRVLIALFAILTELVIVAATANQSLLSYLNKNDTSSLFISELRDAFESFAWRVSPLSGQQRAFIAQYAAIATLLVLTFVLVIVILRGAASFSGAFFTTACVVVASAAVAGIVGSVVDYDRLSTPGTTADRVSVAIVDGSHSPGFLSYSVAMGLVCALVAGLVGAAVRRRGDVVSPDGSFAPGLAPSPYGGEPATVPYDEPSSGYGSGGFYQPEGGYGRPGAPTTELPDEPAAQPTEQLPAGQYRPAYESNESSATSATSVTQEAPRYEPTAELPQTRATPPADGPEPSER